MPTWTLTIAGSSVNTETTRVSVRKLHIDSRVADSFDFTEYGRHFDGTWNEGAAVVFEYPTGTVRFTGRITEKNAVGTGGTESIEYRAVGWRALGQNVAVSRSATDTYPERIYNCADNDIDKAYRADGPTKTVGQIIQNLFDTFLTSLRAEGACHASATPYASGDLTSLTFIPAKMVFASSNFDAAIVALLAEQGPAWSCWVDATGVWRFYDRSAVAQTSVTIASGQTVKTNQLRRHVRNRYTAVKVVGKRGRGQEVWPNVVGYGTDEYGLALSGLTPDWDPLLETTWTLRKGEGLRDNGIVLTAAPTVIDIVGKNWPVGTDWTGGFALFPKKSIKTAYSIVGTYSASSIELASSITDVNPGDPIVLFKLDAFGDVFRLFRITDSTMRDIVMEGTSEMDCCPHVLAVIRNSAGTVVGTHQVAVRLEGDGRIRTLTPLIGRGSNPLNAGESFDAPDVKFVYCYRPSTVAATNILARFPTSGFSGGASGAPWSISRELTVPVDGFEDATATSVYTTLATELHKVLSVVGTSGRVSLNGIDTTYVDPRRRIGISHSGDTTGWESLGAFLTSVDFDFVSNTTELDLSEDGSSDGLNYQAELDKIRARTRSASVAVETKKLGDFINCQDEMRNRGSYDSDATGAVDGVTDTSKTLTQPTYLFPRVTATDTVSTQNCQCNAHVNACGTKNQADALKRKQFVCFPDDRHGIVVLHPGTPGGATYCGASQLAFKHDGASSYVFGGSYYPFVCNGVAIGGAPDGFGASSAFKNGTCLTGWRTLVVVEPFDLADGTTGTQVGVGDFMLQFLLAYDNYMQHNEEAHCCLDTRLLCLDEAIFKGLYGCPTGPCPTPVWQALEDLFAITQRLWNCIMKIHYVEGPNQVVCRVPTNNWNSYGCGAC